MRFALISLLLVGCAPVGGVDSDVEQRRDTEKMVKEAHKQAGMPGITRFQELKLARDILEMRDKELTTYAYIVNLHGDLIFLGEAIGYGLPYSVQFSNPQKEAFRVNSVHTSSFGTLPQAEPNGLFMPDNLSATWLMLKNPETGEVKPIYCEPNIIVSPFRLDHVNK